VSSIAVGELSFISGWPVHRPLCSGLPGAERLVITMGRPGELDAAMARGELAAAPISSLEYFQRADRYELVPDLSISAWGRLGSATLFSQTPFAQLGGVDVAVPAYGATSNALVDWLLKQMFRVQAEFVEHDAPVGELLAAHPAALVIGDAAIQANRLDVGAHRLDLGQAWWQITHTPLVSTVWAMDAQQPEEVRAFLRDLFSRAKAAGQEKLGASVAEAAAKLDVPAAEIEGYFSLLNFDFSPVHQEGLGRLRDALFPVNESV
jgi:chorismate dehydratase